MGLRPATRALTASPVGAGRAKAIVRMSEPMNITTTVPRSYMPCQAERESFPCGRGEPRRRASARARPMAPSNLSDRRWILGGRHLDDLGTLSGASMSHGRERTPCASVRAYPRRVGLLVDRRSRRGVTSRVRRWRALGEQRTIEHERRRESDRREADRRRDLAEDRRRHQVAFAGPDRRTSDRRQSDRRSGPRRSPRHDMGRTHGETGATSRRPVRPTASRRLVVLLCVAAVAVGAGAFRVVSYATGPAGDDRPAPHLLTGRPDAPSR